MKRKQHAQVEPPCEVCGRDESYYSSPKQPVRNRRLRDHKNKGTCSPPIPIGSYKRAEDLPLINPKTGLPYQMSQKHRWALLQAWAKEEVKKKHSKAQTEVMSRAHVKAKHRASLKKTYGTEEKKKELSARTKAFFSKEENRRKHKEGLAAANARPEYRQNRIKAQNDPAVKEKHRIAKAKPGVKERTKRSMAEANARPEVKKRRSEAARRARRNPVIAAKFAKANACPIRRSRISKKLKGRVSHNFDDRDGWVYVLRNNTRHQDRLKIGSASNVEKRVEGMRSKGHRHFCNKRRKKDGFKDKLEVVAVFRADYFRRVETRALEILGMKNPEYERVWGEVTQTSLAVVVSAILQARYEVGGRWEQE